MSPRPASPSRDASRDAGRDAGPDAGRPRVRVDRPEDLDAAAVRACAAGAGVLLGADLLRRLGDVRRRALAQLADGPDVYGVTTGMGALSGVRLSPAEQADHSARLLAGRAVGGPPWLERREARALVAVRLRTFLAGDAAVSPELCSWLAALLEHDLVPAVPRTGSGAAGEILPLAHAWGHLAGHGVLLAADGAQVRPAAALAALGRLAPDPPTLGPKEGIALLAGVPTATALAVLRADDLGRHRAQAAVVAAAQVVLVRATRDPYLPAVARGDDVLAGVLADLAAYVGPEPAPRHLQAPVSFRVVGPVLAHLARETARLSEVADRALVAVGDSPAYLPVDPTGDPGGAGGAGDPGELRFVGTAGFHGLEQAAAFDGARLALTHAVGVGAARLHRMLDDRVTGLPAQLSADPGPEAGLSPLHKRVVAVAHDLAGWSASTGGPIETSGGQEDVQTFALEAAERLRRALEAAREVLACELLAVHQARLLDPARLDGGTPRLRALLDEVAAVLPGDPHDRPWGEDVERLRALLAAGWAVGPVAADAVEAAEAAEAAAPAL